MIAPAVSNALCHEKTRDFFLEKALSSIPVLELSRLPERSQIAYASIVLNASIVVWRNRGPESLYTNICGRLLGMLTSSTMASIVPAAMVRLLGAVGTNVLSGFLVCCWFFFKEFFLSQLWLVHCINSRENALTWDCEPAMLLSSLDVSSFNGSGSDTVRIVSAELRQAFELPLQ